MTHPVEEVALVRCGRDVGREVGLELCVLLCDAASCGRHGQGEDAAREEMKSRGERGEGGAAVGGRLACVGHEVSTNDGQCGPEQLTRWQW